MCMNCMYGMPSNFALDIDRWQTNLEDKDHYKTKKRYIVLHRRLHDLFMISQYHWHIISIPHYHNEFDNKFMLNRIIWETNLLHTA